MSKRLAVAALAVGLIERLLYFLWSPVTYDEAYTYLSFVSQPLLTAIGRYDLANNHPLNSLLAWFSTRLLSGEPMALRLPSLILGVGALFLCHRLFSRLMGPSAGALATLAFAVSPPILFYSTQARGYIGQLCFSFLLLIAILEDRAPALIVLAAALALWSVPTAVYPIAALFLFLLVSHRLSLWPLTRLAVRTAAWTVALYLPIFIYVTLFGTNLPDMLKVGSARAGVLYARRLATYFVSSAIPGLSVLFLLSYVVFPFLAFRKNRELFLLWVCLTCTPLVPILLTQTAPPFERTWLWLAPFFTAFALQTVLYAAEHWRTTREHPVMPAVLVLVLLPVAARSLGQIVVMQQNRTRDLEHVSQALHDVVQPGDVLGLPEPDLTTLDYYGALDPQGHKYLSTRRYPLAGGWDFALYRMHGPVAALREPISPRMRSRIFTVSALADHREDLHRVLKPFGLGETPPVEVPHEHGKDVIVFMLTGRGS